MLRLRPKRQEGGKEGREGKGKEDASSRAREGRRELTFFGIAVIQVPTRRLWERDGDEYELQSCRSSSSSEDQGRAHSCQRQFDSSLCLPSSSNAHHPPPLAFVRRQTAQATYPLPSVNQRRRVPPSQPVSRAPAPASCSLPFRFLPNEADLRSLTRRQGYASSLRVHA